ncbi:hypothetical protein J6590_033166 [Homalodisca vitripennis]|nr:hypothetical protein J6590_033166 [Homalodisca vitripennis]
MEQGRTGGRDERDLPPPQGDVDREGPQATGVTSHCETIILSSLKGARKQLRWRLVASNSTVNRACIDVGGVRVLPCGCVCRVVSSASVSVTPWLRIVPAYYYY